MFFCLPPVGNPVQLESSDRYSEQFAEWFAPYQVFYVGSGATALGAALAGIVRRVRKPRPEVLLPSYTCPEVVSAVLFAGAKPVLVDLEKDRPWMDLDLLASCVTGNTVAVVAVSLFGIPERLVEIRSVIGGGGIYLVEDNAQRFPERGERFDSDVVILSFGRGKPVSVLGGGAVLVRDAALAAEVAQVVGLTHPGLPSPGPAGHPLPLAGEGKSLASELLGGLRFAVMARVYNALRLPRLYWLPESLPFLGLGVTRFKPLHTIEPMDEARLRRVPAGAETYWRRGRSVQDGVAQRMVEFAGRGVMDLAVAACGESLPRLLRYPVLCESLARRDELYSCLHRAGLGASCMYPAPLPEIPGLAERLGNQGPFPSARSFAERILTLPTHDGVSHRDIERMARVFRAVCC